MEKNSFMDMLRDKQEKETYTRRLGHGKERKTLKEKLYLL